MNKSFNNKITINHMNMTNNFGQLEIQQLSGCINVGTTYEGDISERIANKVKQGKYQFSHKNKKR